MPYTINLSILKWMNYITWIHNQSYDYECTPKIGRSENLPIRIWNRFYSSIFFFFFFPFLCIFWTFTIIWVWIQKLKLNTKSVMRPNRRAQFTGCWLRILSRHLCKLSHVYNQKFKLYKSECFQSENYHTETYFNLAILRLLLNVMVRKI